MSNELYKVQYGDSLWKIARERCGARNNAEAAQIVNKLVTINNIKDPNYIRADDDLKLVSNDNELNAGDSFERSGDVVQDYLNYSSSEENEEMFMQKKYSEIPEFEAFHFDRKELEGKSVAEQAQIYKDNMEPLAQGIIDTVDTDDKNGKKDGALNFEEYLSMAAGGDADLIKQMKEAKEIMAKYDTVEESGNKAPDGKLSNEEIKKYLQDKLGNTDIIKMSMSEFNEYLKESDKAYNAAILASEYDNVSNIFTNFAKMDGDADKISKEEYTTFLMTQDINFAELKADSNKKILDVVDGKLNFGNGRDFTDTADSDYKNRVDYMGNLFNAFYGQQ